MEWEHFNSASGQRNASKSSTALLKSKSNLAAGPQPGSELQILALVTSHFLKPQMT